MKQWAQIASAAVVTFVAAGAGAQELPKGGLLPTPPDLAADVPRDFPRFFFKDHDEMRVADLKDLIGVTRKQAVPLLEHLDQTRFTLRRGDVRVPGPRLSDAGEDSAP